jgi:hypothetical protein
MSQVFSKIGSFMGGKGGGIIGTGVSALSNFLTNRTKNKYLQDQINYQKYLRSLSTDPAKMSQYVKGFEKPLDQGLVSGVNNQVQAFGAERGLSTSPQIMQEIEAQALGPLQQSQQQMAINEAMQSLGLPAGDPSAALSGSQPFDITAMIKQLLGGKAATAPVTLDNINQPSGINLPESGPDVAVPPLEVPGGGGGDGGFSLDSLMSQFAGA